MPPRLTIGLIAIATFSLAIAAHGDAPSSDPALTVRMEDFSVLAGEGWTGQLTYLNYDSAKRSAIPVKLKVHAPGRRSLKYSIQYPGEEAYNSTERIRLSRDGTRIDGFRVTGRERLADGALLLTSEGQGEDNGRGADLRMVYRIGPDQFSIRKDVRFDGEDGFFNRNEYRFTR